MLWSHGHGQGKVPDYKEMVRSSFLLFGLTKPHATRSLIPQRDTVDRQFATLGLVLPAAIKVARHLGRERPRQSRRGLGQIHTGQIRRCGTGAAVACFSHRRLRTAEER
jgi:hypothetical protein